MARTDRSYKEDVAPPGSPFRPLYDDKVAFSGQPVALVLADEWEIAKFAATLVRVEYNAEAHATDCALERGAGVRCARSRRKRGDAEKALAAAAVRHDAEYSIPIEHHNPMETARHDRDRRDDDGKIDVYEKTQGVHELAQLHHQRVRRSRRDDIRVLSPLCRRRVRLGPAPAAPGRARRDGRDRAQALGPRRAHPPADVRPRLSARRRSSASRSAPPPAARWMRPSTRRRR